MVTTEWNLRKQSHKVVYTYTWICCEQSFFSFISTQSLYFFLILQVIHNNNEVPEGLEWVNIKNFTCNNNSLIPCTDKTAYNILMEMQSLQFMVMFNSSIRHKFNGGWYTVHTYKYTMWLSLTKLSCQMGPDRWHLNTLFFSPAELVNDWLIGLSLGRGSLSIKGIAIRE